MSSGLYSHVTRATGIILTAAIYNADHQNHITNQNPTMTGALSDNLSEHQSVMDPGDLGTEVLSANLAEELKQLRFTIKRITGKAQWYIPPATDLQSVGGTIQTLTVAKSAAFQGDLTPAQITSNQNNYAPTGHADTFRFRLNTDAAREMTGLVGGATGRVIVIEYIGSTSLTLKNDDAASTAANRFLLGASLTLRPNQSICLQYDNTLSRWTAVNTAFVGNPTFDGNITFAGNTFQAGYTEVTASGTPSAPASTKLRAYAKDIGSGVAKLAFIDKDGLETIIQGAAAPTRQVFTSSGTWNKPANLTAVIVTVLAGGGGSSGSGGSSSFGAHCSATGGSIAVTDSVSPGGNGSGGDINITGGDGYGSPSVSGRGAGPFGGGGVVHIGVGSNKAGVNYGSGAAVNGDSAGGGGGCSIKRIAAGSLGATETVTVGAGGTGAASGNGAPGIVVVDEFYG